MGKIHEKNIFYTMLKSVVDPNTRSSYRRIETLGVENIPQDGAFIIAPNHCNTLMDALVVLRSRKEPTVFGARADLFRKPALAKFLTFLRILPMVRERDGLHNVLRNRETMGTISEVLSDEVPYCIFSEGTHRAKHSLLPIKKGIFRTALTALEANDGRPLSIVPVGIEYSDYFRFRSTCVLEFGKALDVKRFLEGCEGLGQAEVYRKFSEELSSRLSKLITFIPDDELYEGKWALVKILGADAKGRPSTIKETDRENAAAIEDVLRKKPEELTALLDKAKAFDRERGRRHISIRSFVHGTATTVARSLFWIVTLPVFLACAVLSLPIWVTSTVICSKVKDRAFCNSVRSLVKFVLTPILFVILAIIAFCTMSWWAALALCLLFLCSCSIFYDYREFSRVLLSDWTLKISGKGLSSHFAAIRESFLALI